MSETVSVYGGDALPDPYRWQAAAFVRTAWPDVGDGVVTDPYPPELDPVHVVLAAGDLLLGYAGLVRLVLVHDDRDWRVDALGRVFTFPAARGAGRGRRLVDAATATLRSGGADLGALLCEPELRPFYAGSGWLEVPPGVVIEDGTGGPSYAVPGPTMLLPVSDRARVAWASFEQSPLTVPFAW